jgi:hypothetical protein
MHTPDARGDRGLLGQLRPFRRRLVAVHLIEQATVALLAVCAVWATAVLVAFPSPGRALLWIALALAAAIVTTIVGTVRRPWSFPVTAAMVDRALRLDERLTTAVACLDSKDPVGSLILADAARQLRSRDRHDLRPEWPVDPQWLIAGVGAALIAALTVVARSQGDEISIQVRSGLAGTSGGMQAARSIAAAGPRPSDSKPVATPEALRATAARAAARAKQVGSSAGSTSTTLSSNPNRTSERAGTTTAPAGAAPGDTSARHDQTAPDESRGFGGGRGRGSKAPPTAASSGSQGAANGAAAGGGTGNTGRANARGGGIQGAPSQSPSREGADPPVAPARTTASAQYQAAMRAAESPTSQERIPARLRVYVHDYFLAMRPASRGDRR